MRITGIGECKNINEFVDSKLLAFSSMGVSFRTLFELMFREKENVLYEKSTGYRIVETTYGQAYEDINNLAGSIQAVLSGFPKGSVVGMYMDNSLLWIETFWSILAAGYRPLLMNLRLDENSLNKALSDTDAVAVFSENKQFPVLTIDPSSISSELKAPCGSFGEEIMVMSSGTSESVKVCAYSAREFYHLILNSVQIVKNCKMIRNHYDGKLKQLCFLPFYHIFGLVAVYIWFGFFSRTFVELHDLAPQTILNTIRRHKVTHIFAVPLFWEKVYEAALDVIAKRGEKTAQKFRRALAFSNRIGDIPVIGKAFRRFAFREVRENLFGESVQFMISGGSSIHSDVMEFFNGIGYFLTNGYGATEIGITSVEQSKKMRVRNACFVGKPMEGIEYSLSPQGELLVGGNATSKWILENGEIKANDQLYPTRDLAEAIDGHYRILGRLDDLVIGADGENINPNLLEPQLTISGIKGCCLLGVQEGKDTVSVLLVSVNRHLSMEQFSGLDETVRSRLSELSLQKQIRRIVYISDSLLEPQEFKVNRRRLAREYSEGKLNVLDFSSYSQTETSDELYERIFSFFALALSREISEFGPDYDFFLDGGGSSLDYFAMISAMREEFAADFPVADDHSLSTPKEFYDYLKAANYDADPLI